MESVYSINLMKYPTIFIKFFLSIHIYSIDRIDLPNGISKSLKYVLCRLIEKIHKSMLLIIFFYKWKFDQFTGTEMLAPRSGETTELKSICVFVARYYFPCLPYCISLSLSHTVALLIYPFCCHLTTSQIRLELKVKKGNIR